MQKIFFLSLTCLFVWAAGVQANEEIKNSQRASYSENNLFQISLASSDEKYDPLGLVAQREVSLEKATPKEIEKAVEFASTATGVRKEFLMGMLVVESNLGQNTGQCSYAQVEKDAQRAHASGRLSARAWKTFTKRKETLENIANELGYDHEKLKVSCNPAGYAGTGGAMGIPQFMPDTWLEYKERIASVVKKENPDPWDVTDGVVAMALKLSDVNGVTEHNYSAERNAAKMYLSGNTSWKYDWYANQIMYWSRNYHSLMS